MKTEILKAYIIGVALGDGNLSNPNSRATRLRVTCDSRYTETTKEIIAALEAIFPDNKVSIVPGPRDSYYNISVYSSKLNTLLPWQVGKGSKIEQRAHVPEWIIANSKYSKPCLRGLIQTDGSIYSDRGYLMVNFTNNIHQLAQDVFQMIADLGYTPHFYQAEQKSGNPKYTVRLSKNASDFITEIKLQKS